MKRDKFTITFMQILIILTDTTPLHLNMLLRDVVLYYITVSGKNFPLYHYLKQFIYSETLQSV